MSNVKPGQLAMFKPGSGENAGRVVSVVGPTSPEERLLRGLFPEVPGVWWTVRAMQRIARWEGSEKKSDFMPGDMLACPDRALMPLHDGDGTDETLTWGIKPVQRDETLAPRRQVEHAR